MAEPPDALSLWQTASHWLWLGVVSLVGIIYRSNEKKLDAIDAKIDHEVKCARVEIKGKADMDDVKRALLHIETLFANAEADRKFTRDLYDKSMETQRAQHGEVVRLITITVERDRRK